MTDLVVIYDDAQELACIVNIDEQQGWGPAMIGPRAADYLRLFLDTCPFDITIMSQYEATQAFKSFLVQAGVVTEEAAAADSEMAAQSDGSGSLDTEAAGATAEAAGSSDVPAPQPADTDMEADAGSTEQIKACVNCNGVGSLAVGDPPVAMQCGMCKGTGQITVPATA